MANVFEDDEGLIQTSLFREPADYFQKPKVPSKATHCLKSGELIELDLVGHNPLWGHLLWNAGRTIADFLEENSSTFVSGKAVLELGAGAGLPGLVCALNGASRVVITDYPDTELIENIQSNITRCDVKDVSSIGLLWGSDTHEVKALLEEPEAGFDLLILADLLFNHSEHGKLVQTIQETLRKSNTAHALVFFTPYRPWLMEKDLGFFDLADGAGFSVSLILEKVMEKVLFEEDPGDELLRRTVYGYDLQWKLDSCS
ncbi:MAG: nicotinamide n-methyltransferase [Vezdaea aestivalis]|nr:MAG: nicotinamide n-methyltransferase [Vezdaea aestivalis]